MQGKLIENLIAKTEVVVGTAQLHHLNILNTDDELSWVQVFDAADADDVTLGTTVPVQSFPAAASGGTREVSFGEKGLEFSLGIVVAATKGATNDTAAETGIHVNLGVAAANGLL